MSFSIRSLLAIFMVLQLSACANFWSWGPQEVPTPPPRVAAADEHGVVLGDTVYSIAFRNQLDYRELARWNGVGSNYLIVPGQILRLTPPPDMALAQAQAPLLGEVTVPQSSTIVTEGLEMPVSMGRPVPLPPGAENVATAALPPQPLPNAPVATPPGAAAPAVSPAPRMVVAAPPADAPPIVGHHPWQVPTQGAIVRSFAPDRGNKGLDFTGALGQPVIAAAAGKVVYSGSALKGYGELVIIKHDDTRLSAYGYNQRRLVNEGEMVRAGQQIAELGMGPGNEPVLHFEIRERGKPVNPAHYLPSGIPRS